MIVRTKGEAKGEAKARRESEKREAKAMQPSCTEPNPRGTKGKKQEGWEKEKGKRKGGERGKEGKGKKEKRKEKGKASPKIIGRGYGLASAVVSFGY